MSSSQTFATRIDLPEPVREKVIGLLNQQLADSFDLFSQIKQAHWNVKGPQFIALHELFDKLAEDVEESVDMIAERATALGGTALGTARMAAGASRLPEYPADAFPGPKAITALARSTRAGIDLAANAGDADTADVFTEVSRSLDKNLWFLEAHLQA
jgi:starvation-inducible DNA-binding protein